jgi:penicillin-binding protein 1A
VLSSRRASIAGIVYAYSRNLPDINKMADYQPSRSTRVFARDGTQLADALHREPHLGADRPGPVPVRNAFIATEDQQFLPASRRRFRRHRARGIRRLAPRAVPGRLDDHAAIGARLFLSNEVSISRKVQEALLAIEIERYYTKDEILERYLNIIYFGSGAYGIEAAAHTYFGTDVSHLTIGQAAMLAGMPAAPSRTRPT